MKSFTDRSFTEFTEILLRITELLLLSVDISLLRVFKMCEDFRIPRKYFAVLERSYDQGDVSREQSKSSRLVDGSRAI